jgi:hypothetical protein
MNICRPPRLRFGRHSSVKGQVFYTLACFFGIVEDTIGLLSFGFFVWELRARFLFYVMED